MMNSMVAVSMSFRFTCRRRNAAYANQALRHDIRSPGIVLMMVTIASVESWTIVIRWIGMNGLQLSSILEKLTVPSLANIIYKFVV